MNLQAGYFRIGNPFRGLDRLLNPYVFKKEINVRDKPLRVVWTRRAENSFQQRPQALIVEMQIYFSCVVKKRVLFHEQLELPTLPVNDKLNVCFHAVESNSCDPEEFAKNYPVRRNLTSAAAMRMRPSSLKLDYIDKQWVGEFQIGDTDNLIT